MGVTVETPRELLESVANLRLPDSSNQRLQLLMDRNNEGKLSAEERDELAGYAAVSEEMATLRAKALKLLGRTPT